MSLKCALTSRFASYIILKETAIAKVTWDSKHHIMFGMNIPGRQIQYYSSEIRASVEDKPCVL